MQAPQTRMLSWPENRIDSYSADDFPKSMRAFSIPTPGVGIRRTLNGFLFFMLFALPVPLRYSMYMTVQTSKVKDGTIQLPEELRSVWENADVYITSERDRISIKRLSSTPLVTMLDEMNEAGKGLNQDDVDEALRSVRQ